MKTPLAKSAGFSLIEVLFAVFIFSVGLLGIAGLQLFAKQNSFDAIQRTTAALLATEIAEKIRANPVSAALYISSAPDLATATLPTTDCTTASECSSSELASYDLKTWYEAILGASKETLDGNAAGGLSSPSACISSRTNAAGAIIGYDIAIAWRGKTPLANPVSSACGESEALYGTGNAYRRVLLFSIAV